jgi:hypothetical protein
MFKALKESWQQAKKKVEAEEKAQAARAQQPAAPESVGARMAQTAGAFATSLSSKGVALDFSPVSVRHVDGLLAGVRKQFAALPPQERRQHENAAVLNLGSYLGEVLRREEGGVWIKGNDDLPAVDLGSHIAPTLTVVFGLLTQGAVSIGDTSVDSAVDYYHAVVNQSRAYMGSLLRGTHASVEDAVAAASDDPKVAVWVFEQSDAALRTAMSKWGLTLDFSPASLEGVENVLAQLHEMGANAPEGQRPTDQQVESVAVVWGAYVGEVLRRHYGGKWELRQPEGVLQLVIGEATAFPLRKVQKRILNGPVDHIPHYFNGIGVALKS